MLGQRRREPQLGLPRDGAEAGVRSSRFEFCVPPVAAASKPL
jgi:hypothetical protein